MKKFLSPTLSISLFIVFCGISCLGFIAHKNNVYHTNHAKVSLFFNLKIKPIYAKLRSGNSTIYVKDSVKGDSVFFYFEPKNFDFDNPIAESHIKEKYLETQKYAKISFKGKFVTPIDYKNPKNQKLKVKGILQMKKHKREEEIFVNVVFNENDIKMNTNFILEASNYGIMDEEHKFIDGKDNITIALEANYKIKTEK